MTRSRHTPGAPLDPAILAELDQLDAALRGDPIEDDQLATLVRSVQAQAPEMPKEFRSRLTGRVAAGFPRRSASSVRRRATEKLRSRRVAFSAAGTVLALGVAAVIVLAILGVPYAFALAILIALTDLIPLVGATIGAAVCTAVAFFHGTTAGIVALIFFVAYQQFENFVVVPRVMKKTVDVSPLVTIIAALIGGSLLGILGALLAIPIAAALQLILGEVVFPRQEKV